MKFAQGREKTGGRRRGVRNKRTVAAQERPDALGYLESVMSSSDAFVTPDLKLRAAIALAQYQHPRPTPARTETILRPIDYAAPTTIDEARVRILEPGEPLARGEIPIELHDSLVAGLRTFLGDKAVEQQKYLDELEESLRRGDGP
jgi:hypothetical protein